MKLIFDEFYITGCKHWYHGFLKYTQKEMNWERNHPDARCVCLTKNLKRSKLSHERKIKIKMQIMGSWSSRFQRLDLLHSRCVCRELLAYGESCCFSPPSLEPDLPQADDNDSTKGIFSIFHMWKCTIGLFFFSFFFLISTILFLWSLLIRSMASRQGQRKEASFGNIFISC